MKAIILAGGKGTRLLPVTRIRPKPMAPLLGQPVICHIIALLGAYGVTEAAVAVSYMAHSIESALGDFYCGVRLRFFNETEPLGTAGAAAACRRILQDEKEVIVVSGDAVTDCRLDLALGTHRGNNADATLIVSRSDCPLEYGTVVSSPDGRITGFTEKPEWSQVASDRVNTGIYILKPSVLDLVPEGVSYDFSRDLFPRLLQNKYRLYSHLSREYWCDVGTVGALRRCNLDALAGRIRLYLPLDGVLWEGSGSKSFISSSASVDPGALVSDSVVGRDCVVEKGATVTGSVLLPGCRIMSGAVVKDSLLDSGVMAEADSVICSDSAVGSESVVHAGSLCAGERLEAKTRFSNGSSSDQSVYYDDGDFVLPSDSGRILSRLGAALESFGLPVTVSSDGSAEAAALTAGVQDQPTFISDADHPRIASFSAAVTGSIAVHLYQRDGTLRAVIFMPDGYRMGAGDRRKLVAAFNAAIPSAEQKKKSELLFIRRMYQTKLCAGIPRNHVGFHTSGDELGRCLAQCVPTADCGSGIGFAFSREGVAVDFGDGASYPPVRTLQFLFAESPQRAVYLDPPVPGLLKAGALSARELDDAARRTRQPTVLDRIRFHDPAFAAVHVLRSVSRLGLEETEKRFAVLEDIRVENRLVLPEGNGPDLAARLLAVGRAKTGGVKVFPSGIAAYRIYAESVGAESARELCDVAERKLRAGL